MDFFHLPHPYQLSTLLHLFHSLEIYPHELYQWVFLLLGFYLDLATKSPGRIEGKSKVRVFILPALSMRGSQL